MKDRCQGRQAIDAQRIGILAIIESSAVDNDNAWGVPRHGSGNLAAKLRMLTSLDFARGAGLGKEPMTHDTQGLVGIGSGDRVGFAVRTPAIS